MTSSTATSHNRLSAAALRHLKATENILFKSGLGGIAPQFFRALRVQLLRSPDDAMAMTNLLRFVEASFNPTTILHDLALHAVLMDTLLPIFGFSQYFSDLLIRDPELFRWLTATNVLDRSKSREEYFAAAAQSVEPFHSVDRKINVLKRFQRRETLRIGVRDILRLADLETTTRELSHLADALLGVVSGLIWEEQRSRYGVAPNTPWAIFGLGKLGGEELNYSSDIDLIAIFDEEGEFAAQTVGMVTHGEFFVRFIERIVEVLSHRTEEGHFYRVDMRLRPDGKAGALIRSFASTMMYYESRGELWERQMLIKARRVAGDKPFAKKCLDALAPFIYPRTFFANPVEEISRIKSRIEAKTDERNIKLRAGGIRDIEFAVQTLQLLNGGKKQSLRDSNTLETIGRLSEATLLSAKESTELSEAYIFFRTLEHRLQMMEYAQTHSIPSSRSKRVALAARMSLGPARFELQLSRHLKNVRRVFDTVFSKKSKKEGSDIERFLSEKPDSDFARRFGKRFGLRNLELAARNLRGMMYGSTAIGKKEYTERTRTLFENISKQFLMDVASSPAPDQALENSQRIASAFPSTDSLYLMLGEQSFRKAFVTICARSSMLTKRFVHSPSIAESILTGLDATLNVDVLPPLNDGDIHGWKAQQEIKAAVQYILGARDERSFFLMLSDMADRILAFIYSEERKRLGMPDLAEFCILGLGKLGGREININSDLDVIFLFRSERGSDAEVCEELAANIMTECSRYAQEGKLYDIDARLRPEGKSAPLAVASDKYLEYLHHRASLWERQSLTRARFIAGDKSLAESMLRGIGRYVFESALPQRWTHEILSMRKKTESRSRTSSHDFCDIKLGAGGMMDVEFAVQALQLSRGHSSLPGTNMFELLSGYRTDRTFGKKVKLLEKSYRSLRRVETAMRTGLDLSTHILPADDDLLGYLARLSGYGSGSKLLLALHSAMRQTRMTFESILQELSLSHPSLRSTGTMS